MHDVYMCSSCFGGMIRPIHTELATYLYMHVTDDVTVIWSITSGGRPKFMILCPMQNETEVWEFLGDSDSDSSVNGGICTEEDRT